MLISQQVVWVLIEQSVELQMSWGQGLPAAGWSHILVPLSIRPRGPRAGFGLLVCRAEGQGIPRLVLPNWWVECLGVGLLNACEQGQVIGPLRNRAESQGGYGLRRSEGSKSWGFVSAQLVPWRYVSVMIETGWQVGMDPDANKIQAGFHNDTHIVYLATVKLLYFFMFLFI